MQTDGQHANDFETIVPALRRAREKLGATHVLFGPQRGARARSVTVFSPHGRGYVKRKVYANSGLYHWPAVGHVVAKLPRGVESIDGYTEGSEVRENPIEAHARGGYRRQRYESPRAQAERERREKQEREKEELHKILSTYEVGPFYREDPATGERIYVRPEGETETVKSFSVGEHPYHGVLYESIVRDAAGTLYWQAPGSMGFVYAKLTPKSGSGAMENPIGELEYGEALRRIEEWAKRQGWKFDTAVPLEGGWWDVTVRKRIGARAEVVRVHEGELESPRGGEPLLLEFPTSEAARDFFEEYVGRAKLEHRVVEVLDHEHRSEALALARRHRGHVAEEGRKGGEPLLGAGEKYRGATIVKTRTGWYTPTYGYGSPTKERLKELIDQSADWVQKSGWKASEPALAEEKYRGATVQKTKRGYYTPTYGYGAGTKAELKAFIDQSVEWIERSGWKADSPQGGEPGGEPLGGAKEPPKIEAHRTVLPWGGDGWAVDLDFIREGLRTYGTTRKEAIEKAVRDIQAWKRGAWRRRARENSPQGGEPLTSEEPLRKQDLGQLVWTAEHDPTDKKTSDAAKRELRRRGARTTDGRWYDSKGEQIHYESRRMSELRDGEAAEGDAVPWVRITRDPKLYEEGIRRAKEIGPIDSGRQIYELLSPALSAENQEVFLVVLCNLRQECIGVAEVHRGERSRVSVSRADILQVVTKSGADHFHVVHNHPSGDPTPSEADRKLTEAIQDGAVEVEIPCVDHVVIGMGKFYSFAEGKVTKVR
jgi:proteasome lid subunit RPN8/RPN11